MKPTFQTKRSARRIESPRPSSNSENNIPAVDWSFQAGADLRIGASTPSVSQTAPVRGGLYSVTQGLYDAQTKWEDRIEAIGVCVVIAVALWPIWQAIYIALDTV